MVKLRLTIAASNAAVGGIRHDYRQGFDLLRCQMPEDFFVRDVKWITKTALAIAGFADPGELSSPVLSQY